MVSPKHVTRIIAHVDHGKTTIMDSIISQYGYISKSLAGDIKYMDSRPDEQEREITLKLGFIGLKDGEVFIDTPGHVDFESLIFSSAILADRHIIVVDCNEGITPRAYTLFKCISPSTAILIINKIDRCSTHDTIIRVIEEINALVGSDIFRWENSNVVLSDALMCCGLGYSTFLSRQNNTIKKAFKTYKSLLEIYDKSTIPDNTDAQSKIAEIMSKYNIKLKNKKSILSTLMPLGETIYKALNTLKIPSSLSHPLYKIEPIEPATSVQFYGITACGIFKEEALSRDNVLFVCRILQGSLSRGAIVYSSDGNITKTTTVNKIYKFEAEQLVEVFDTSGLPLVCLDGDFLKNSLISESPSIFIMPKVLLPFYSSKLVLFNLDQLNDIKKAIKALSYVEQPLKAKKNKFSEIEIQCSGQVQLEKICTDLRAAGFDFAIEETFYEFRETILKDASSKYISENLEFEIRLSRIDDTEDIVFEIHSEKSDHIVESVLEMFTSSGPFIHEKIIGLKIEVLFTKEDEKVQYNILSSELKALYNKCSPVACPKVINLRILVDHKYVGAVYSTLQRHHCLMDFEDVDENTGFSIICARIPVYCLGKFSDDLKLKTQGTAYVEVSEGSYVYIENLDHVKEVRKKKGLITEDKIINNPEQQRTLKW